MSVRILSLALGITLIGGADLLARPLLTQEDDPDWEACTGVHQFDYLACSDQSSTISRCRDEILILGGGQCELKNPPVPACGVVNPQVGHYYCNLKVKTEE